MTTPEKLEQYWTVIGFQLGLHVAEMQLDTPEQIEPFIDKLQTFARGEDTPFSSGAELQSKFPEIDSLEIEEALRDNRRALQRAANVVLDKYLNQD